MLHQEVSEKKSFKKINRGFASKLSMHNLKFEFYLSEVQNQQLSKLLTNLKF
jgi:hypothetical protein